MCNSDSGPYPLLPSTLEPPEADAEDGCEQINDEQLEYERLHGPFYLVGTPNFLGRLP